MVSMIIVNSFSVFLKPFCEGGKLQLGIEISQEASNKESLLLCKISVLNRLEESVKDIQDAHRLLPNRELAWTFPHCISCAELTENSFDLLPQDTLSLRLEFTHSTGVEYEEVSTHYGLSVDSIIHLWNAKTNPYSVNPDKTNVEDASALKTDMLSLFHEKTLSDFELKAENKTFLVHKTILCARSSVFKAMLTSQMQEGNSNSLNVPDVDAETLTRMLLYVYSDTVEDLDLESASKLYYVADKYEILPLMRKCSSTLKSFLTVSNVIKILVLAEKHQDLELTSAVHDFILSCDKLVMQSTEWLEFDKSDPQLAAKTIYEVYKKKLQL